MDKSEVLIEFGDELDPLEFICGFCPDGLEAAYCGKPALYECKIRHSLEVFFGTVLGYSCEEHSFVLRQSHDLKSIKLIQRDA